MLLTYTKYNLWANQQLLGKLSSMNAALLDKEIVSSFPSLRKTIFHILDAELIWMCRLKGEDTLWPPTAHIKEPSITLLEQSGNAFIHYMEEKPGKVEKDSCSFRDSKGTEYTMRIDGIIMHVVNHSSFHRGQVITLLRQLGETEIPRTDLIVFLRG